MLEAACAEAMLAVRLYNDPAEARALEGFIVHMHMAWLYLLHAKFTKIGVDTRYRRRDNPRFFVKVDGEHKQWELARCVQENWNEGDATRANIEFFIGLRNRVEHRYSGADANLLIAVAGHAQAHLLNFETELLDNFGPKYSMARTLRFPIFVGTFTAGGQQTLIELREKLPSDLKNYIAMYHSGLTEETVESPQFEMRLRVILERATGGQDSIAMQFTRWDDMTTEEQDVVAELGKRGQTIIREQKRAIVGHGLLKPGEVAARVESRIPFEFSLHEHHTEAWRRKDIRPATGSKHPERTMEQFCIYDQLSSSYGFTEEWVNWLARKCTDREGFKEATGKEPRAKESSVEDGS